MLRHLKNKWVIAGLVAVILIILIIWARSGSTAVSVETASAAIGNVIETVSVTGTISPVGKSDLSFKKGGVIASIYVKVGDSVSVGQPIASLDGASDLAALHAAQATLADTARGLTPEELAVAKTSLDNAEKDALNAAHEAYVKTQSALFNYTDMFFNNAQSPNPIIAVRTDGVPIQISIDQERLNVSGTLSAWSQDLSSSGPVKPGDLISRVRGYLDTVKSFMSDLSGIVSALNQSNSGLTQAAINTSLSTMNAGLSAVSATVDSVTQAQTALSTAQSNYDLKLAGNSAETIAAQSARTAQAQAEYSQDTLVSPIDGIVTKADPNVGEYIAPGQSGFAVQNSDFKIEARVPEADIAKIAVGNLASTTLDAYGSDIDFPARVITVDPAETVLEGVPTYKVTLVFIQPDPRIRSGMTANLDILTHERSGVLVVPYRAIVDNNGAKSVRRLNSDGKTWTSVPVSVGLKGSTGSVEIVSGLSEGDKVVTYVK